MFASISGQHLNFNLPFSPDDSVKDIGIHLSEILANGINKTRNLLDPVQLEITAYNIKKSHRVFLFGKGDSRISLENFKNKMIKLNEYFIIGDEYQEASYTIGNITSDLRSFILNISIIHKSYGFFEIFDILLTIHIVNASKDYIHHILHRNMGRELRNTIS